jgi:tight adherence protein C
MMAYLYWGAVGVLAAFILLQLYDIVTLQKRSALDEFLGARESEQGMTERIGRAFSDRFSLLKQVEKSLEWAHLGGKLESWSLGGLVVLSLGLSVVGFGASLLSPAPAAKLLIFLGALPLIHAQTAGSRVKKRVERTLPETSALIAAELSAGSSGEDALLQAAQLPGPLAEILGQAVDQAANAGRPLTSRGTQIGMLREVLSGMGLPALRGFAVQLDSVAQSGVESGERMGEIASTLAAEYRQRIRDHIKTLDKKLTLAVSAFYFAPFFLILLMGTFGAALSSF